MNNPFARLSKIFKRSGYEGAAKGRRTKNWNTTNAATDVLISSSAIVLRSRSRDLVRNNPYAAQGVNFLADYIVGAGITGTIKHPDAKTQDALNAMWKEWADSKQPDFDGRSNFAGLQHLACLSMLEAGEVFVRARTKTSGFPLELQLLEADYVPVQGAMTDSKAAGDNKIINGIEYNARGKRVAYHMYQEHPNGMGTFMKGAYQTVRVESDEIAHVFRARRPGQGRGIPALAPVLIRLRDVDEYEDAQLIRQKIAACFAVFIHDIDGSNSDLTKEEVDLIERVEPGMIEELAPGKTVSFGNPPPVQNYKEYMSVNLHAVAAGLQISYEALTGDLSEVNYSSIRAGMLRTMRTVGVYRNNFKASFLDPVSQWFFQRAFLMGIDVKGAKMLWTPPRVEMIDPTKEIPAQITAIRGGLTTLSEAIRENGRNPEETMSEWAEDAKNIDSKKLTFDSDPRKTTQQGSTQKAETATTKKGVQDDEESDPQGEDA